MYDQNNMPAQTQVSHYLRTGRLLPAEYFANHKSGLSAYDEDDFLSYKSWNTLDFWNHYKTGNGQTIDLQNVGLLDRFCSSGSVRTAVEDFKNRQIRLAKQKAMEVCRGLEKVDSTIKYIAFSD